jgi:DUF4097 and DUF4098 domain-containing protein YvlB
MTTKTGCPENFKAASRFPRNFSPCPSFLIAEEPRMNLPISLTALLVAATFSSSAAVATPKSDRHSTNFSESDDGPVADCSGLHIRFEERAATILSEERTIPRSAGTLTIQSEVNGGLQVQGWDKDTYSVTACKAFDPAHNDANQLSSQIKLSVESDQVSVTGPSETHHWTVFLIVRTPKSANLELHSKNGPLGIYNVDGQLTAKAVNGPVSLRGFSGDADISAQNGPIDLSGNSGNLRLHTENGPISVALNGDSWQGVGLEAEAKNGPLTLRIPKNYQSGVLVESNGSSPMSCHASACDDARKTWDDHQRRIEFGKSPAVIRLSTTNGPIAVRQENDKL